MLLLNEPPWMTTFDADGNMFADPGAVKISKRLKHQDCYVLAGSCTTLLIASPLMATFGVDWVMFADPGAMRDCFLRRSSLNDGNEKSGIANDENEKATVNIGAPSDDNQEEDVNRDEAVSGGTVRRWRSRGQSQG